MEVVIRIADRCKIPSNSEKALVFTTRVGRGTIFTIPVSQIIKSEPSVFLDPENEYSHKATEYTITSWIYNKIKEDLDSMYYFNYKLIN